MGGGGEGKASARRERHKPPKFPNHSPPCRYDDHASFRVTRCTRGVHEYTSFSRGEGYTSFSGGDVILAWC